MASTPPSNSSPRIDSSSIDWTPPRSPQRAAAGDGAFSASEASSPGSRRRSNGMRKLPKVRDASMGAGSVPSVSASVDSILSTPSRSAIAASRETVRRTTTRDLFLFLLAFRLLNALTLQTFFQPDEFYQVLEPAWKIAFGPSSGAWITWEWKNGLRSAIHPYLFAALYMAAAKLAELLHLSTPMRAELLIAAPKVFQAVFAALGDLYTWKLAERIYGRGGPSSWAALALTITSPWQWFCSTRTFSNSLETTLTAIALDAWPWQWTLKPESPSDSANELRSIPEEDETESGSEAISDSSAPLKTDDQNSQVLHSLRRSLILAGFACVLRPTNILIWSSLAAFATFSIATREHLMPFTWTKAPVLITVTWPAMLRATAHERWTLLREVVLCGLVVLALAAFCDHAYYGRWEMPPLKFLYFNIVRSLSVFYGSNPWHYYLTQALPLLLTTSLPFATIGLYKALQLPDNESSNRAKALGIWSRYQLAVVCIIMTFALSLVSHKEVRFIYPLLPVLYVLAAKPVASCFASSPSSSEHFPSSPSSPASPRASAYSSRSLSASMSHISRADLNESPAEPMTQPRFWRPSLIPFIVLINLLIALFATQFHQRGVLAVIDYLRHEHEARFLSSSSSLTHSNSFLGLPAPTTDAMTVGFFMPCHSTPWRSHLVHSNIHAWALGCEPPLNLSLAERATYRDEADRFYDNPDTFLTREMGPLPNAARPSSSFSFFGRRPRPHAAAGSSSATQDALRSSESLSTAQSRGAIPPAASIPLSSYVSSVMVPDEPWNGGIGPKPWPTYLVFFAAAEPVLLPFIRPAGYAPCWRGWNSWFHDDWRRRGDVVVWCRPE